MTSLCKLCDDGKLDGVILMLARGADVNKRDCNRHTPLMWAVIGGHNLIVNILLDQPGVNINGKTDCGFTALHYAVLWNNPEGAKMLLLHPGMNSANSTNTDGKTALSLALRFLKKEVLLELVKHKSVILNTPAWVIDEREALAKKKR